MEKWNLYDRQGELTDRIHRRGDPIPEGYFHLVIHIWFRDERGRFLIQQRARTLAAHPGIWAATGGSALVGESSLEAVQRETLEELGLQLAPDDLRILDRFWGRNHFVDLWFSEIDSDFARRFTPTEEVDAIDFRSGSEIYHMLKAGSFFPYEEDYLRTLGISDSSQ